METDGGYGVGPAVSTAARIYRWGMTALVAAVLIQAFLGGRGFFLDRDVLTVHGRIGDALFLLALAHLVVLVFVQLSLGYSDDNSASVWHLPNGVLIFGLAVANAFLSDAVAWTAAGPPAGAR